MFFFFLVDNLIVEDLGRENLNPKYHYCKYKKVSTSWFTRLLIIIHYLSNSYVVYRFWHKWLVIFCIGQLLIKFHVFFIRNIENLLGKLWGNHLFYWKMESLHMLGLFCPSPGNRKGFLLLELMQTTWAINAVVGQSNGRDSVAIT